MARTDNFRSQHKEIGGAIQAIEADISSGRIRSDAMETRKKLASLAGKLAVHLAMEDKNLYPMMQESANAEARQMATSYMNEMGTLALSFKTYVAQWPTGKSIKANADGFAQQTREVFQALRQRIEREEKSLYPLADSL